MRRKVPIICSEGGALPEIAGEAALFFKPGDVSDLCRSMVHLYGDDDLIKRLIIAGENRVKDFNWETTFSNMHQVFSEVSRCSGSA
jgi:glycosyltransferase involved in cell wall biosynthesis